jgi:hypothetical protein
LVIALRPQTPKHIRGGWSQYDDISTDTSKPVDGNGAQNMVTVQSEFRTRDLSITGPTHIPTALTGPKETERVRECESEREREPTFHYRVPHFV